ncbi:MAG TPA: hypothetical protein VI700_03945 [Thermoanaerobaculaceae bacterium]|nr:hypothetical protein [Thermoanaerobaculaceae bacterium]
MRRSRGFLAGLGVAGVLLAGACASSRYADWTGLPITRAMHRLGQPKDTMRSGDGSVVYVFDEAREVLCGITATEHVSGQVQGALGGVCGVKRRTWTFVVDGNGAIVRWKVGGWRR